ncbi:hypothetical protein [Acidithiobacillus sp.]|uniref:hypothetical protein n=1 Tax=Acidithiobacillus sp. TaxID=1872118 RepID=UPI0025BC5517|nr:hypothetical protein [Acidithiobacillus sp.]
MELWELEQEMDFVRAVQEAESAGVDFSEVSDDELRRQYLAGKDLRELSEKRAA